ncbi:MAG: EthD family reductase [Burkholderiaceae bacterium]|jgi:uncharacterized protein (TIGR02118 family)|nr:EthD family reductase [Burkholderiaceae bacterium]
MTIPAQIIPPRLLEPLRLGRMTLRNRVIMAPMSAPSSAIKVVYCIRRRAGLSAEEFQRYWKEVHAPMLLERAASMRLAAYVQTSPIKNIYSERVERPSVLEPPFDGIAELYWANEQDMRYGFESAEALALQRQLAQDEANFIDPARSARWIARETAPIPRSSI